MQTIKELMLFLLIIFLLGGAITTMEKNISESPTISPHEIE